MFSSHLHSMCEGWFGFLIFNERFSASKSVSVAIENLTCTICSDAVLRHQIDDKAKTLGVSYDTAQVSTIATFT